VAAANIKQTKQHSLTQWTNEHKWKQLYITACKHTLTLSTYSIIHVSIRSNEIPKIQSNTSQYTDASFTNNYLTI